MKLCTYDREESHTCKQNYNSYKNSKILKKIKAREPVVLQNHKTRKITETV